MYLNCHTYFSFLYGAMSPEQLVAHAAAHDVSVLAVTDINNTSAWYDVTIAADKAGLRIVPGVELRDVQTGALQAILLPCTDSALVTINEWLYCHLSDPKWFETAAPTHSDVAILEPWYAKRPLSTYAPDRYLLVRRQDMPLLHGHAVLSHKERLLAWNVVNHSAVGGYELHRVLQAVHQNTLLSKVDLRHGARADDIFLPKKTMLQAYAAYPFLLEQTCRLLDRCCVDLELKGSKNKQTFTGSRTDDRLLLEKLALDGYTYRYGHNPKAKLRVQRELKVIDDLGFNAYFLITWDFIRYAQSRGYYHIGRGSGANSIVAYCLRITDVDPLDLDLYFERFINPHRNSPPDFDIDFSWDQRDDVIDYVFKRYGRSYVALLATYQTFKGRSILRELGKVFGLPKKDIDILVEEPTATDKHHDMADEIRRIGVQIVDFPDHLSIHAGGLLVTEQPIFRHTSLMPMPKGFPTTHFDMYVAEEWGFYKYDILSQRGLGHIKDAVVLIHKNKGQLVDIHRIQDFKKDPRIRESLRNARTIGCFYIESPAIRGLLSKLRCEDYITLVAASSIIRPGVAKSGMMRAYIERFHDPSKITYIHPVFEQILRDTYGVMVYQEDVIKVAHHFAGLDLAEADILRRAMSGKYRGKEHFMRIRQKFFDNCRGKAYPESVIEEVWRQIESFSGYSFCKSHSASFAVESYQSLYLKTYFPLEFMVAVINNFGGFYSTELYVHEARMAGAQIEVPCVNHSELYTTLEGSVVYLGFAHVKSLESATIKAILDARMHGGVFRDLADFMHRVSISRAQMNILIRVGALRFTGKSVTELLWQKNAYYATAPVMATGYLLDDDPMLRYTLPPLETHPLEQVYDHIELIGFPLCSPFELLQTHFRGDVFADQLLQYEGMVVRMVGYFVTRKDTRTIKGELMHFGTWLDVHGRFFDTVHFPNSLAQSPFSGKGCYLIRGRVVTDFGFPMVEVDRMARLPYVPDPRHR